MSLEWFERPMRRAKKRARRGYQYGIEQSENGERARRKLQYQLDCLDREIDDTDFTDRNIVDRLEKILVLYQIKDEKYKKALENLMENMQRKRPGTTALIKKMLKRYSK